MDERASSTGARVAGPGRSQLMRPDVVQAALVVGLADPLLGHQVGQHRPQREDRDQMKSMLGQAPSRALVATFSPCSRNAAAV